MGEAKARAAAGEKREAFPAGVYTVQDGLGYERPYVLAPDGRVHHVIIGGRIRDAEIIAKVHAAARPKPRAKRSSSVPATAGDVARVARSKR